MKKICLIITNLSPCNNSVAFREYEHLFQTKKKEVWKLFIHDHTVSFEKFLPEVVLPAKYIYLYRCSTFLLQK